jgi:hypothetical protein
MYPLLHNVQFWESFWPNFFATITGVIIGIPIALLTNRSILKLQSKKERKERQQRLKDALYIIRSAMHENIKRLNDAVLILNQGTAQFDIELNFSAWDVDKDEIIINLDDIYLKQKISRHFSNISSMIKMSNMYLGMIMGIESTLDNGQKNRDLLKINLLQKASIIYSEIEQIVPLIENRINSNK